MHQEQPETSHKGAPVSSSASSYLSWGQPTEDPASSRPAGNVNPRPPCVGCEVHGLQAALRGRWTIRM